MVLPPFLGVTPKGVALLLNGLEELRHLVYDVFLEGKRKTYVLPVKCVENICKFASILPSLFVPTVLTYLDFNSSGRQKFQVKIASEFY